MALVPKDKYPSQIDTSDPAYPHGKARNVGSPGDGTGTPWEEDLVNDVFGFQQALLDAASITPSGTPDKVGACQYLDALNVIIPDVVDNGYPTPKARVLNIDPTAFKGFKLAASSEGVTLGAHPGGVGWRPSITDALTALVLPLNGLLPTGAEITQIELGIFPSTKGSSPGTLQLFSYDVGVSPHVLLGSDSTSGTAGQVLTLNGSFTMTPGLVMYLVYDPGSNTGGADVFDSMTILFNDPGPRNY